MIIIIKKKKNGGGAKKHHHAEEEEEWTPLKRPLLLLGSLSLASSFVAYKKKHLNWFKTSYACACVTFGPAMVLYALRKGASSWKRNSFLFPPRPPRPTTTTTENDDDSSKRREEREKETKRKNKEMLERMKRVKL